MRTAVLLLGLAACSARPPTGPAWPRSAARDADGGESLAPHAAARRIAASTTPATAAPTADDAQPADKPAERPVAPTAPGSATSERPATSAPASADEPVNTEELVIEVED
jgi:hypothetical protein